MRSKTESVAAMTPSAVPTAQSMILSAATPCGLFEASNCNRYLVGDDGECKFAIALQHASLPAFTWLPLTDAPIERGKWRGRYALRLTHAVRGTDSRKTGIGGSIVADGKPGVLGIGDGAAIVCCRRGELGKFWMPLGYVTETEFCGYNGWALVDADNGATFFEQVPRGQRPSELLEVFETQPELPAERVRARKKG